MIGRAWYIGCELAITEAMVPVSMTGNIGKSQAGVMDCRVSGLPLKRMWYWVTALRKERAR